jgi:hypothetical protein
LNTWGRRDCHADIHAPIIAWELRRYGFGEEAARIAAGILDAARYFKGRLPEAFAAFPRTMTPPGVPDGVQPAGLGRRHADARS